MSLLVPLEKMGWKMRSSALKKLEKRILGCWVHKNYGMRSQQILSTGRHWPGRKKKKICKWIQVRDLNGHRQEEETQSWNWHPDLQWRKRLRKTHYQDPIAYNLSCCIRMLLPKDARNLLSRNDLQKGEWWEKKKKKLIFSENLHCKPPSWKE